MNKLLQNGEVSARRDYKEPGIFTTIFEGETVPDALNQVELITPGVRIMAISSGRLLLAGTVCPRPYGFLPYSLYIKRDGSREMVEVELPLNNYYLPQDKLYGPRVVGGGISRRWEELGSCVLENGRVVEHSFEELAVYVGKSAVEELALLSDSLTIQDAANLLLGIDDGKLPVAISPSCIVLNDKPTWN